MSDVVRVAKYLSLPPVIIYSPCHDNLLNTVCIIRRELPAHCQWGTFSAFTFSQVGVEFRKPSKLIFWPHLEPY